MSGGRRIGCSRRKGCGPRGVGDALREESVGSY